MKNMAGRS